MTPQRRVVCPRCGKSALADRMHDMKLRRGHPIGVCPVCGTLTDVREPTGRVVEHAAQLRPSSWGLALWGSRPCLGAGLRAREFTVVFDVDL